MHSKNNCILKSVKTEEKSQINSSYISYPNPKCRIL